MKQIASYLGMLAALVTGFLLAMRFVPAAKPPALQPLAQPEDPLSMRIAKVDLDDTSYGQAINYLRELTHINLVADWDELKELEVTPATPLHIDLHLHDVTLGEVLHSICMAFQEPHPTFDVYVWTGYQVEKGFVVFTRVHLQGDHDPFETRIYDVTNILEHPSSFEVVELATRESKDRQWAGSPPTYRLKTLIDATLNEEGMTPPAFDSALRLFCGKLIVTDTAENQARIEKLLNLLDQLSRNQTPPDGG